MRRREELARHAWKLVALAVAYFVWRDGAPVLAAKGVEAPATDEQAETVRRFSADVKSALG